MWPYTTDESNWLDVAAVMEATRRPPTVAELERAARRERARVIAGGLRSGFFKLRRLVRAALYRRGRGSAKPPPNVVGAD